MRGLPKDGIGLSKYESTCGTCAIANTQCCKSVIRNVVYNFDKSNNTIVKALLSSSIVYSSRIRSHWRGLLYVHGVMFMAVVTVRNPGSFSKQMLSHRGIIGNMTTYGENGISPISVTAGPRRKHTLLLCFMVSERNFFVPFGLCAL